MAVRSEPEILIRDADASVLDDVVRMESASFPSPWTRKSFERELVQPQALFRVAYLDRMGSRMVGYICSWFMVNELHILKIAVDERCRRMGVATRLLEDTLYRSGRPAGFAYLEVRPGNAAALDFYNRMRFDRIGRMPGYYPDTGEDAILLFRGLP